jgi:hypothetical protein
MEGCRSRVSSPLRLGLSNSRLVGSPLDDGAITAQERLRTGYGKRIAFSCPHALPRLCAILPRLERRGLSRPWSIGLLSGHSERGMRRIQV